MSVSLKHSVVPTFGRHETFTLRYSWLKRGYDAVAEPDLAKKVTPFYDKTYYIFNDPDAHHILDVGKNMARSIRFWLQACRVVEEFKVPGSRAARGRATAFGEALLATHGGLDPYLEHAETWWLVHWMMVSPGSYLPVWWTAFHSFPAVAFTTEQLLEHVQAQVAATAAWHTPKSPHPSTIKKDVLALLRCYAGTAGSRKRDLIDDELDKPFVPLTLIRTTTDERSFRFGIGPKPGLAPAVAAFACLDFLTRTGATARQVLIASLAAEQGGPGRAFKLTERDLTELLEKAAADAPDLLQMTSTAGSDAVAILGSEPLDLVAARVLHRHYVSLGADADEPAAPYVPWTPGSDLGQTRLATNTEEGSA
jgi:hypothetical protein